MRDCSRLERDGFHQTTQDRGSLQVLFHMHIQLGIDDMRVEDALEGEARPIDILSMVGLRPLHQMASLQV